MPICSIRARRVSEKVSECIYIISSISTIIIIINELHSFALSLELQPVQTSSRKCKIIIKIYFRLFLFRLPTDGCKHLSNIQKCAAR